MVRRVAGSPLPSPLSNAKLLLGNALAPSAMLHRVAAVLYGMVQHGGTYEAPRLLFPTPDNVSGPPHDLAFTRRGADSPDGVFENSDERGVGRREKFTPSHRSAFRAGISGQGLMAATGAGTGGPTSVVFTSGRPADTAPSSHR